MKDIFHQVKNVVNFVSTTSGLTAVAIILSFPGMSMAAPSIPTSFPTADSKEGQSALCWPARGQPQAILLCLHGIQTHAGWFELLGEEMARRHTTTYALNRGGIGHKDSVERRGDIDDWHRWIDDIRNAALEIQKRHPGVPIYLVGVSWGAKTALGALIESDAKLFDGSVLIAPALKTTKDPSMITRGIQKLVSAVRPLARVDLTKRLKPDDYTTSVTTQKRWLIGDHTGLLTSVTQRFLTQSNAQFNEAKRNIAKVPVPVLVLFGTGDTLVKRYESDQVLRPLREDPPPSFGQAKLTTLLLKDLTHASIVEAPQQLAKIMHEWIEARRGSPRPDHEFWLPAYATAHGINEKTGKCTARITALRKKAHGIATGIKVKKDDELRVRWDSSIWWQDERLAPVQAGGTSNERSWAQKLGRCRLILKKNQDGTPAAYFTVLAHVKQADGSRVTSEIGFAKDSCVEEVLWKAPASGELYLSANDSTMVCPSIIFTNNTGTLRLRITTR